VFITCLPRISYTAIFFSPFEGEEIVTYPLVTGLGYTEKISSVLFPTFKLPSIEILSKYNDSDAELDLTSTTN